MWGGALNAQGCFAAKLFPPPIIGFLNSNYFRFYFDLFRFYASPSEEEKKGNRRLKMQDSEH